VEQSYGFDDVVRHDGLFKAWSFLSQVGTILAFVVHFSHGTPEIRCSCSGPVFGEVNNVFTMYICISILLIMDARFELHGIVFVWDEEKARFNRGKHGASFERAAEVFFDPFAKLVDASRNDEAREALIGVDFDLNVLYVAHVAFEAETRIRIISARPASGAERKAYED